MHFIFMHLIHPFLPYTKHARQAQQAQLGTYWSNQVCQLMLFHTPGLSSKALQKLQGTAQAHAKRRQMVADSALQPSPAERFLLQAASV